MCPLFRGYFYCVLYSEVISIVSRRLFLLCPLFRGYFYCVLYSEVISIVSRRLFLLCPLFEVLLCYISSEPIITLQVNLYLLSRIVLGSIKVAVNKGYLPNPSFPVFPLFAGLMWGLVLCLFEYQKETLQQSLQNSMTYIYHDSLVWSNIWDFLAYNNSVLW